MLHSSVRQKMLNRLLLSCYSPNKSKSLTIQERTTQRFKALAGLCFYTASLGS